jgi:hypothetical protein
MISKSLTDKDEVFSIPGAAAFQFSGVQIGDDTLGATEYTLASLIWDKSGSVSPYAADLDKCLKDCVEGCRKSPRADNLMLRTLLFNQNLDEMFGFKELKDIDPSTFKKFRPSGSTALFDAAYNGIAATLEYSKKLIDKFFSCNGVVFVMTDGDDNASTMTKKGIKDLIATSKQQEIIDSLVTVLIRIEDPNAPPNVQRDIKKYLDDFQKQCDFDAFVDMGKVTPQRLAKLAQFVSQSVSSASQNLQQNPGSKSAIIAPTF